MTELENYYDEFAEMQSIVGINKRHLSVHKWCLSQGIKNDSEVLEIGCGIGTYTELLAKYCTLGSVDAYDISQKNIDLAKVRLKDYQNVSLFKADVTAVIFKKKYDYIILPDVLEHIPIEKHNQLFKSLALSLKEKGSIIIHIPNPLYLEWCHENKPEVLQILDQPLHTNLIINAIYDNGLYLHFLQTYSIWIDNSDYQIIVLRKNQKTSYNTIVDKEPSVSEKIKNRINKIFK